MPTRRFLIKRVEVQVVGIFFRSQVRNLSTVIVAKLKENENSFIILVRAAIVAWISKIPVLLVEKEDRVPV